MTNGLTNSREDFDLCVRAENVDLPRNGYFGVSAATGALAGQFALVYAISQLLCRRLSNQNQYSV